MERYIGVMKAMRLSMSQIDMSLANKVITLEHLNHLPPITPLVPLEVSRPGPEAEFPQPGAFYKKQKLTDPFLRLLQARFYADIREWPVTSAVVKQHKKYHIRWRLSVGSVVSQDNLSIYRRDDSYIWWKTNERNSKKRYGRVEVFCDVYNWEGVAVVRAFKTVKDPKWGTLEMQGKLGSPETILVTQIGGLIGRIPLPGPSGGKRMFVVE